MTGPDGRVWTVRRRWIRLPDSWFRDVQSEEDAVLDQTPSEPSFDASARPHIAGRDHPLGFPWRRPWIEASAERPAVTMVWRATGRADSVDAVEEIAAALGRGESLPRPLLARWVGYERGGMRLARKL